jgi:hypothetical protein
MIPSSFIAIGTALTLLAGLPAPAEAQATGRDKFHAQARVGNKVCMIKHEHYAGLELVHSVGVRPGLGQLCAGREQKNELYPIGRPLAVQDDGPAVPA